MTKKNRGGEYVKWSSLAIQGVATIVILLFIGRYFDQRWSIETPIFTIIGILLGTAYFFYSLFKAIK